MLLFCYNIILKVISIYEASKIVHFDRLYLSHQCDFSTTEEGNILTKEEQWDKLRLIKEIAIYIVIKWGLM